MAKGNMLQGMARGKVGDVVFSRLNGEQIARVRNRNPKNPRTNAQLYQRAIMATVMAAYSAGKVIFDHSFQGYAVGEANQRRFMSENAKYLRGLLAADLAQATIEDRSVASFNGPGISYIVPSLFKISEGTYTQSAFIDPKYGMLEPLSNETVAQYASRANLVAGDIYTLVFVGCNDDNMVFVVNQHEDNEANFKPYANFESIFGFVRLQVKQGLEAVSTTVSSNTTLSALFNKTMEQNCSCDITTAKIVAEEAWMNTIVTAPDGFTPAVAGFIRSRLDEDLRSTSFMSVVRGSDSYDATKMYGLSAQYLLAAWKQGSVSIGDSDLILEGGND